MEVNGHSKHKILQCFVSVLFFQQLSSASNPPDLFLIDCGNSIIRTSQIGSQEFVGDAPLPSPYIKYASIDRDEAVVYVPVRGEFEGKEPAPSPSIPYSALPYRKLNYSLSSPSTITLLGQNPSAEPIYRTTRVFEGPSSYKFKLKAIGLHVVRLHFFPSNNMSQYNLFSSVFDVSVLEFPLLRDFRVQYNSSLPVIKEYFLWVEITKLTISFKPSARAPSWAFVNAIEVFSAPDNLIVNNAHFISSTASKQYKGLSGQVLETIHRINVGGPKTSSNDALWRTWLPDEKFLKLGSAAKQAKPRRSPNYDGSPEGAPLEVYRTAREIKNGSSNSNMTWIFPHGKILISILTNQVLGAPYYTDFVANSDDEGLMRLSLGPSEKSDPSKRNAILNGVEIMKMKGMISAHQPSQWKRRVLLPVGLALGSLLSICAVIIAILLMFKQKWKSKVKDSPLTKVGRKISLAEIQLATNNFDESLLIGRGGFGNVYKGVLRNGMKAAVKRSTPGSRQGHAEFCTEIMIFSKIRHRHLVSLIGYCDEQSEMILVYEFMEKGTLRNQLCGTDGLPGLSWRQRLLICIGSARGLHYLHTGPALGVIHRDIKSTNILLDENYVAKIADFGISRPLDSLNQSHVTIKIKGSFGYFDPEYFRSHHLTNKSDVYSFGVVLLEVLCARPAVDHSLPFEQVNLANWAMQFLKGGLLGQIADPRIRDEMNADSLQKFGKTAESCLAERSADRPTMAEVLWNLEYALRLQDMATNPAAHRDSGHPTFSFRMPTTPTIQNELESESICSVPVPVRPNESSSGKSPMTAIFRTW